MNHRMQLATPLTMPGNRCVVHRYHWPVPARTVVHHILPQEYGGPDTPENKVPVCDTGHYNIHAFLDALVRGLKLLPKVTRKEEALARRGYFAYLKTTRGQVGR